MTIPIRTAHALVVLLAVPAVLLLAGCSFGTPSPATNVSDRGATLNGAVYSSERPGEVRYSFKYGTTTAYGRQTPERTLELPAGDLHDPARVSEPLSGLEPGTTYHFRLCTSPPENSCLDRDESFTTASAGPAGPAIAFESRRDGNLEIYTMRADGSGQTRLTATGADDQESSWSPDGKKLAFTSFRDGNAEIYTMNADGSNQVRLTFDGGQDREPAWSPDGSKIAFSSTRGGPAEIFVMGADGSNQRRLDTDALGSSAAWSPDGRKLVFVSGTDLYVMNADGSGQVRLTFDAGSYAPAWSPDGRRIAFTCNRGSHSEICVIDPDGSHPVTLTSTSGRAVGFFHPAWSPDGSRIAMQYTPDVPRDFNYEIYAMNADGSGIVDLSNNVSQEYEPAWSPRP